MEANTKQQQLLFDKGITNVPSDNLCSDNTLAESVGMVYDNGEHRVIQKPKEFITSAVSAQSGNVQITGLPAILYVHKFNDETRYIANATLTDSGHPTPYTGIVWGTVASKVFTLQGGLSKDNQLITYENGMKITSVGKTLVVAKSDGMDYFLWKNGVYGYLGPIPEPKITFWFESDTKYTGVNGAGGVSDYIIDSIANTEGIFNHLYVPAARPSDQEAFNDLIVGLYSKNKKLIKDKGGFCEPFFIRYALRLYDGTHTHISNPILMFPCVTKNSYGITYNDADHSTIQLNTKYSKLHYSFDSNGLEDFDDILDGVDIFISDGISPYSTDSDQKGTVINDPFGSTFGDYTIADGVFVDTGVAQTSQFYQTTIVYDSGLDARWAYTDPLAMKKESDIINEIKAESIFYKICDIGLRGSSGDISERLERNVLVNLTSQEALENDDYYSRCVLHPTSIYSYNSRLNIAGVKRGFFEGFDFFLPWDNSSASIYDIYVTIKTDTDIVKVKHVTPSTYQKMGQYFYYPDSRATDVVIMPHNDTDISHAILRAKLTEHPGLNGAYYIAGLPASTPPTPDTSGTGTITNVSDNPQEVLYNYVIQSEVDNPYVFKAEGYFKVGTGKIIGMSSITQALSEGQFGSYPLLVFSESGVWALSVASTGYYSSIHPMSREVCNNADSITQTDGAVFFTSEKGLMVVVGSQVKCVSEQLSGMNDDYAVKMYGVTDPLFPNSSLGNVTNYFRNCMIAYDYRDSLLWIFSRLSATYCYIYSIKSGTFSKYRLASPVQRCVNDYPDYLLQGLDGNVLSLLNRSNINYDTHTATVDGQTVTLKNQYSATMLTRPLKLENALALKSIMHVKHIKQFSSYEISGVPLQGYLTFRIFASNNLESWVEIGSLRGVPWKYYRFRYDFVNLIATDRFAGTVLVTQERRTDKLR